MRDDGAAIAIGTAGWAIGSAASDSFPANGSGLERYSTVFRATEINSSFHRSHRLSTWQRWHDSVPADFRFSAKIPKEISHQRKLVDCGQPLSAFLGEAHCLREKLAFLLLQLPPKLEFDATVAECFLTALTESTTARIVCEPRNATWFTDEADLLLKQLEVARVAADPACVPGADVPGGWRGVSYRRLHGSPDKYRSSYADRIDHYAERICADAEVANQCWCIFDNTASSAAISDALLLGEALNQF